MENQTKQNEIPNLGGLITADDLYYKGKVPFCSWAKTAQRIRENAPNWFFALEPDPNGQLVWMAPDNTGYLMGYFQNIETGIKLPLYVYSITNNFQKGIQYDKISTTDIQKAHRRCLCACACYSFGDAFELWAGLEVKEAKKEEEPEVADNTAERTPTKINQEPEENYLLPEQINEKARDLICDDIRKSGHQKEILKDFKEHFKLKVGNVRPENITLSEHGRFLRQAIEKYNDKN
tara:strand:+ start:2724 stop:3428 length:705 start_codon:yes stop_codon:yes gene_type:complete